MAFAKTLLRYKKPGEDESPFSEGLSRAAPLGVSGGAPPQQSGTGPTGGRFAQLQDYLRVNQAGGKQMADKAAGKVEEQAALANTKPAQSAGQATNSLAGYSGNTPAPTPAPAPKTMATAASIRPAGGQLELAGGFGGSGQIRQAAPAPTPAAPSAPAVSGIQRNLQIETPGLGGGAQVKHVSAMPAPAPAPQIGSDAYGQQMNSKISAGLAAGRTQATATTAPPTDTDRLGAARSAESLSGLLDSQGGREAYLGGQQKGSYSAGERGLDAALMGQGGGSRFQELAGKYKGLYGQVSGDIAGRKKRESDWANYLSTQSTPEQRAVGGQQDAAGAPKNMGTTQYQQRPYEDRTKGEYSMADPNTLSDGQLSAMGYMNEPAPGESGEHFSDRMNARAAGKKYLKES